MGMEYLYVEAKDVELVNYTNREVSSVRKKKGRDEFYIL